MGTMKLTFKMGKWNVSALVRVRFACLKWMTSHGVRIINDFGCLCRDFYISIWLINFPFTSFTDRTAILYSLRWSNRRQIFAGGRRLHMAWILPAMLRLSIASRSTAFMFLSRATSLLQGRLCKVSLIKCYAIWGSTTESRTLIMQKRSSRNIFSVVFSKSHPRSRKGEKFINEILRLLCNLRAKISSCQQQMD